MYLFGFDHLPVLCSTLADWLTLVAQNQAESLGDTETSGWTSTAELPV